MKPSTATSAIAGLFLGLLCQHAHAATGETETSTYIFGTAADGQSYVGGPKTTNSGSVVITIVNGATQPIATKTTPPGFLVPTETIRKDIPTVEPSTTTLFPASATNGESAIVLEYGNHETPTKTILGKITIDFVPTATVTPTATDSIPSINAGSTLSVSMGVVSGGALAMLFLCI